MLKCSTDSFFKADIYQSNNCHVKINPGLNIPPLRIVPKIFQGTRLVTKQKLIMRPDEHALLGLTLFLLYFQVASNLATFHPL